MHNMKHQFGKINKILNPKTPSQTVSEMPCYKTVNNNLDCQRLHPLLLDCHQQKAWIQCETRNIIRLHQQRLLVHSVQCKHQSTITSNSQHCLCKWTQITRDFHHRVHFICNKYLVAPWFPHIPRWFHHNMKAAFLCSRMVNSSPCSKTSLCKLCSASIPDYCSSSSSHSSNSISSSHSSNSTIERTKPKRPQRNWSLQ